MAVATTLAAVLMGVIDSDLLTIPGGIIFIFFSFYTSKLIVATFYENFPKYLEIKFLRYFLVVVLAIFMMFLFILGPMGGITPGGH